MYNFTNNKWLGSHVLALGALCSSIACSGAEYSQQEDGVVQEMATSQEDVAPASPPSDSVAEPFSLTPEGATNEGGYWVSVVDFDESGKPVLVNARKITEEEMLEHQRQRMAQAEGDSLSASAELDGSGFAQTGQALGQQVSCDTGFAAPTYLGLYSGANFGGNRMCITGGGNLAWFALYTWFWDLGGSNEKQVSGNINSYEHYKRFGFNAWTQAGRLVQPTGFPVPFDWGETASCFSGAATNCGNPNGCSSGGTFAADVGGTCAQFVTWLRL